MPRIEIREFEKVNLKNPTIIEGFPGIGMIGTIGASYLAEKLGLKLIGTIASTHFPPVAAIHNYKPVYPARIYASEKHDLIVLFSEFVIPMEVVFPLSEKLILWAREKKAKSIISLAGIASPEVGDHVYGIASTPEWGEKLKALGVDLIREGATQGVSGVLIAEAAVENFPAANLMIQTDKPMDPAAAAKLLKLLSKLTSIPIDTKQLETEGQAVESRMREAMEKMKTLNKNYSELENNPSYG